MKKLFTLGLATVTVAVLVSVFMPNASNSSKVASTAPPDPVNVKVASTAPPDPNYTVIVWS